jgi:ferredoxin
MSGTIPQGAPTDIREKVIGSVTVRIDRLLCVGFGDCIEGAEQIFELDEEGIVRFLDGTCALENLLQACRACPVDALTVFDAEGRQLVP